MTTVRGWIGHMQVCVFAAPIAALALPGPACADAPPPADTRVAVIQQLFDCRSVGDPTERLACYDRQVAAVEAAETARDIRIVDREQVRETRRGLFGFSLGSLSIFGGGNDDDRQDSRTNPEIVQEIEAKISAVDQDSTGRWVFALDNGQRWVQQNAEAIGRTPHVGNSIRIRRAAFGTFMANIEDRPGFRIRRER